MRKIDTAFKIQGGITIKLIGAPEAQAQGLCRVFAVRSGVDGNYRVSEVTHSYSRDGGGMTVFEINYQNYEI